MKKELNPVVDIIYPVVIGLHLRCLFNVQKGDVSFIIESNNLYYLLFIFLFFLFFIEEWLHDRTFLKIPERIDPRVLIEYGTQILCVVSLSFSFILSLAEQNLNRNVSIASSPPVWFLVYLSLTVVWLLLNPYVGKKEGEYKLSLILNTFFVIVYIPILWYNNWFLPFFFCYFIIKLFYLIRKFRNHTYYMPIK